MFTEQYRNLLNQNLLNKIPPWLRKSKFNAQLTDEEICILKGDKNFISSTVLDNIGIDRFIICALLADKLTAEETLSLLKEALTPITRSLHTKPFTIILEPFVHQATMSASIDNKLESNNKPPIVNNIGPSSIKMIATYEIICPYAMALTNLKVLDILKKFITSENLTKYLSSPPVKEAVVYSLIKGWNVNNFHDFFEYPLRNSATNHTRVKDILFASGTRANQMLFIKAREMGYKMQRLVDAINNKKSITKTLPSVASQYHLKTPGSCDSSYASLQYASSLRATPKNTEIASLQPNPAPFFR